MKKVVLFKSESEEYHKAFVKNNFEAIFVEPLQFVFLNLVHLFEKIDQSDYNGLILTSPRAIEAVAQCWNPSRFAIWNTKRIYTVGEASALKIKVLLGLEALGSESGSAENLSHIITRDTLDAQKFLFPCGNLRSETITDLLNCKGMTVDALTVYETKENESLRTELMELSDSVVKPCCMVFFSPSGCEYIHRQLQTFSNDLSFLPHFAIGNSTAHKIEILGAQIAGIAARPKAESIADSVKKYFLAQEST